VSKIYEVAVQCEGEIRIIDGIESERYYWLVPQWIEDTARQRHKPARAIRLDGLKPFVRQPGDDWENGSWRGIDECRFISWSLPT
jgi:hypothetical protein